MTRATCPTIVTLSFALLSACSQPARQPTSMEIFSDEKDYSRPLPPGTHALRKLDPHEYPSFVLGLSDQMERLRIAVEHSLQWLEAPSSAEAFPFDMPDGEPVTHGRMRVSLQRFREILLDDLGNYERAKLIQDEFDVYESVGWDGSGTVLFTAYCEYVCNGSLVPSARFKYPLYRRPDDLEAVIEREGKYYSRAQIDREGVLKGANLELVYLESPLDCYLVQVQGSAQIKLAEGGVLRVGWAGDNRHEYQSIGQLLVKERKINPNRYSLEEMRRYFERHPEDLSRVLNTNPRYIFFRETTGQGPCGSLGIPVTPMVSIATDKSIFPRSALCFVETELPDRVQGVGFVFKPFHTFAFDQDTGGAIRSAGRCDMFLGRGAKVQEIAGHARREGRLYYLFLKPELFQARLRIS